MGKTTSKKEQLLSMKFKTTADIKVPKKLADQVIGQEKAIDIIKKAAKQGRNVLLVGQPGTGKSMIAQAMSELLPPTKLKDILVHPNLANSNNPRIEVLPAGKGRKIIEEKNINAKAKSNNQQLMIFALSFVILSALSFVYFELNWFSDVVYAAYLLLAGVMMLGMMFGARTVLGAEKSIPKLLIDNDGKKKAPFVDATGARAGALLGDCKHDPLQSSGLGTPAHLRIINGAIHRANGGVLFIDEIANLSPKSQQELLTAMQERKYAITGQSEHSSGAMTITEPVPCDFLLVASGNYDALKHVHPALRSRIRGYGYEIYMNENIDDNLENRNKIARFVAQEIAKDGKIPPFSREAVEKIISEAKRRAATKGKLTLKLRDLGGLVRTAGDVAKENKINIVKVKEVESAIKYAKSLERQMADEVLDLRKKYEVIKVKGSQIGRVNGLAVLGNSDAGLLLPVEAEVTPGGEVKEIIATGQLGKIAQEAIKNVSAIVKKYFGKDLRGKHDIYVQFLQSTGGVEGDSASIAIATAVISAFLNVPVRQDVAMTGSLSVRGEVLPVGGVSFKLQAAYDSGIREIIIPEKNKDDIVLSEKILREMKIHTVSTLDQVLKVSLVNSAKKRNILKKISHQMNGKKH